jgi:hypothetical protein
MRRGGAGECGPAEPRVEPRASGCGHFLNPRAAPFTATTRHVQRVVDRVRVVQIDSSQPAAWCASPSPSCCGGCRSAAEPMPAREVEVRPSWASIARMPGQPLSSVGRVPAPVTSNVYGFLEISRTDARLLPSGVGDEAKRVGALGVTSSRYRCPASKCGRMNSRHLPPRVACRPRAAPQVARPSRLEELGRRSRVGTRVVDLFAEESGVAAMCFLRVLLAVWCRCAAPSTGSAPVSHANVAKGAEASSCRFNPAR